MTIPEKFHAGDTLSWRRSLADYPASAGWVLSYTLVNAANKYSFSSTASDDEHGITVSSASTSAYLAGIYTWVESISKSGERYTLASGTIEIKPDLIAAAGGVDLRLHAQKMVDAFEAAWLAYAQSQFKLKSYQINDVRTEFRDGEDLKNQLAFWRTELRRQQIAAGLKTVNNRIFMRL